jgi:uncharacterized protein
VHEFQHSKLNALMDLCDLFDRSDDRRIAVGWRDDDRPIEGVLHGAYAHIAVAEVWRARAERGSDEAGAHFRRYRDWTTQAIEQLSDCGALTPAGLVVLDRMAETLTELSR